QAKRIGCSWATWKKTQFYAEAKKKMENLSQQRNSKQRPQNEPVVSLTSKLESMVGEGARDQVLNQLIDEERSARTRQWHDLSLAEQQALIAEQEADYEPSPLEDDSGPAARKVRSKKRL